MTHLGQFRAFADRPINGRKARRKRSFKPIVCCFSDKLQAIKFVSRARNEPGAEAIIPVPGTRASSRPCSRPYPSDEMTWWPVSTREGNHQVALIAGSSANLRLEQPRTESKWESINYAGCEDGVCSPSYQKRRKRPHHFVLDTGKKSCPGGARPFTVTAPHRQEDPDEKGQHRARARRVDREVLGGYRSGGWGARALFGTSSGSTV